MKSARVLVACLLAAESRSELATEVITLPEALKSRGYTTAFFGMWNLGRGRSGPVTPGGQDFDTVVFPANLGFALDACFDADGNQLSDRIGDNRGRRSQRRAGRAVERDPRRHLQADRVLRERRQVRTLRLGGRPTGGTRSCGDAA